MEAAMRIFKSGRAADPSEVTSEMFNLTGDTAIDILFEVIKNIIKSYLSPEK